MGGDSPGGCTPLADHCLGEAGQIPNRQMNGCVAPGLSPVPLLHSGLPNLLLPKGGPKGVGAGADGGTGQALPRPLSTPLPY